MSRRLSNISLKQYQTFLKQVGCKNTRNDGGHQHWTRTNLLRQITVQTHIDPVPEFIIKNGLRTLNISRDKFFELVDRISNKKRTDSQIMKS